MLFRSVEMSQEEYDKLPEFMGWQFSASKRRKMMGDECDVCECGAVYYEEDDEGHNYFLCPVCREAFNLALRGGDWKEEIIGGESERRS